MMEISPLFHSTRPEGPLLPQEEAARFQQGEVL